MAQTALTVVGYVVGYYYGGPAGASAGAAIGSYIGGQYEIANQKFEGARINDLKIPNLEYGSPITRLWGSCRLSGNVIWTSEKREIANTTGGKGGAEPEVTNYTYEVDVLVLLVDNPIVAVPRVWANGKLIYTTHVDSDLQSLGASAVTEAWTDFRVYTGAADQLPDPVYEAAVGIGNAPAYRHRGTVMIEGLQLGGSGQMPALTFEVCTEATLNDTCVATDEPSPIQWQIPFIEEQASSQTPDIINWVSEDYGVAASIAGVVNVGGVHNHIIQTRIGVGGCKRYFEADITYNEFTSSAVVAESLMIRDTEGQGGSAIGLSSDGTGAITADGITSVANFTSPTGAPPATYPFIGNSGGQTYSVAVAFDCDTGKLWVRQGVYWFGVDGIANPATGVGGYQSALNTSSDDLRIEFCERAQEFDLSIELRTTAETFVWDMPAGFIPWAAESADADVATPGKVDLADVVRDLCVASELTVDQVDVTELEGTLVDGVPVTQVSAARATLGVLASTYYFDCVESDKLYFRFRGRAVSDTIPFEDIGAAEEQASDEDPLGLERANDIEVPARYAVQYINIDADYQAGTVYSDRLVSESAETRTIGLPMVLEPERAQGVVETVALDSRVGSTSIRPSIDDTRPEIEPTDVILVFDESGNSYRTRLIRETYAAGVRKLEGVLDDASVLSFSGATQGSTPSFTVATVAKTLFELLDIPILRDADNAPGIYAVAKRGTGAWPGAELFSSSDGAAYTSRGRFTTPGIMGEASTVLGDHVGNVWDRENIVTVDVGSDALSSSTEAELLNSGTNAALIGSEIIQFRTATFVAEGIYILSVLLRGRRGTEWAIPDHVANERFVLLTEQTLIRATEEPSTIGVQRYWKAVTLGRTLASAEAKEFTDTGIALKPFSVQDIRFAPDASQGLEITWRRRSRLAYRFMPPLVPLGEDSEQYRVTIESPPGDVLRTTVVSAASMTYTRAEQLADGVDQSTPLTVTVTQLSAVVGDGYPASSTTSGIALASTAQQVSITLGGVFDDGQLIRVTLGGDVFDYTTVPASSLNAAATAIASLIDASATYSASAAGPVATATGPVSTAYPYSAVIVSGDNTASFAVTQSAVAAAPARSYAAYVTLGRAIAPSEPVPAGNVFGMVVYQGATNVGEAAYAPSAPENYPQVLSGLSIAFANAALSSAGYTMTTVLLNGTVVGYITGPSGVSTTDIATAASGGYSVYIAVIDPGAAAIPVGLPQIVELTFAGTPTTGNAYRATLGGVLFSYTALGGDTMADIATALASLIDASPDYIASSVGSVITIERSVAAVAFSYAADIVSGSVTVQAALTQEAS